MSIAALTASAAIPLVDFETASGAMIRLKLAQACIANLKSGSTLGERALQILIHYDLPKMISEVFTLRPELHMELQAALNSEVAA